ncbi:DUF1292 domain-containing protein [bacterium]|nr:DUF1292 domain-containing protein [bacterium]
MSDNVNNDNIIETIDEHGNLVKFELVDIVEVDEIEYGLLYPIEGFDIKNPEKAGDKVIIMRLKKDGEDFIFEKIEDDEEFDKVADYVTEITEAELAEDDEEEHHHEH